MKKIILCLIILLLCGCSSNQKDSLKFKEEYEKLNDVEKMDGSYYIKMDIPKDNPVKYSNYEEIMSILDKTGVIYFGFSECPWCRTAVPILLEALKEKNIKTLYYYNVLNERDRKELIDGEIVVKKQGTENYYNLVEKMYHFLPEYEGLNDETIKRIYFPTVVFVKNGEIVGLHVSTISSQTDVNVPLTSEQKEQLKSIYKEYISLMNNPVCDIDTAC